MVHKLTPRATAEHLVTRACREVLLPGEKDLLTAAVSAAYDRIAELEHLLEMAYEGQIQ